MRRDIAGNKTGGGTMCLAVPMQITAIDGFQCTCEARGIEREVSLFMLQGEDLAPGDHVLVHVGYAIQKVSEEQAAESWVLFDEILEADA
jgi:hydrogenase expression/formation protein HypC